MSDSAPVDDPWDPAQFGADLRAARLVSDLPTARRAAEVARLRLIAAMQGLGMVVSPMATIDELHAQLNRRAAEKLRRLAR